MAHNIPRFSNPHLLPESSQSVSRKRLRTDSEDEHEDAEPFEEDLLQNLHQHLSSIEWDTSAPVRHCEGKAAPESSELVFRLWSTSAAPQSIKLSNQVVLTKSIPRPKPPAEDTKDERKIRRRRAKEVAIDAEMILKQSSYHSQSRRPPTSVSSSTLASLPTCMVISRVQPLRNTRPPVPVSELQYHPYARTGTCMPLTRKIGATLVVDLDLPSPKWRNKRTRHKRKKNGDPVIARA